MASLCVAINPPEVDLLFVLANVANACLAAVLTDLLVIAVTFVDSKPADRVGGFKT